MKISIVALLLGAVAAVPEWEDRWYPSCNIVEFTSDDSSGKRYATHKCKAKEDSFKCCRIALDDCVAVESSDGSLFVRGSESVDDYKSLASNCIGCSYYGYSMSLYCLCGRGNQPKVFEPRHIELRDVLTNNNGILGNNDDPTKHCVAKEVDCPK